MVWKDGDNFSFHRVRFMYTTNRTWRRVAIGAIVALSLTLILLIALLLWYFLSRSSLGSDPNQDQSTGVPGARNRYAGCFPSNATVITRSGGATRMDQLRLGDQVLDLDHNEQCCRWSGVYAFAYIDKDTRPLTRILLDDHSIITLTSNHLLFRVQDGVHVRDCQASQIIPGDALITVNGTKRVRDVQCTLGIGGYAPLTYSGSLLVDGVWVSCFAGHWLKGIIGHRFLHQYVTAPLRALSSITELTGDKMIVELLFLPHSYHLWYVDFLESIHSYL